MDNEVEGIWKEAVVPFVANNCGKPREYYVRAGILTGLLLNDSKKVSKLKLSP
jgi:hypothetical protein